MSLGDYYNRLLVPISEQDHIQGLVSASVALVEYGDYQCLICGEAHQLIKAIQQQLYDLCFVFRHFPQPQIHPYAQRAAEAAQAAAAQGQFWQMHDILFTHQQALGNDHLVEYANNLGLDIPQFLQDISSKVHINRINQDIESGLNSGVTAAPALFINEIRYIGRWNIDQLMAAIITVSN
ncbi:MULTISPECIES: DsbA family protein [Cyanophyceae]|jgi:protein-disulfide isomerase|uniref:DsbA family protein n=1 Tax=Cyanophyceae TaxID=3028117 RepID=UPI001688AD7F|nr:DsbA family protein [Trichocoleus sp. FACHB-40]MBD2002334.1 DsbA family protein [Trichocoleus sp. FACHB-40]